MYIIQYILSKTFTLMRPPREYSDYYCVNAFYIVFIYYDL